MSHDLSSLFSAATPLRDFSTSNIADVPAFGSIIYTVFLDGADFIYVGIGGLAGATVKDRKHRLRKSFFIRSVTWSATREVGVLWHGLPGKAISTQRCKGTTPSAPFPLVAVSESSCGVCSELRHCLSVSWEYLIGCWWGGGWYGSGWEWQANLHNDYSIN